MVRMNHILLPASNAGLGSLEGFELVVLLSPLNDVVAPLAQTLIGHRIDLDGLGAVGVVLERGRVLVRGLAGLSLTAGCVLSCRHLFFSSLLF